MYNLLPTSYIRVLTGYYGIGNVVFVVNGRKTKGRKKIATEPDGARLLSGLGDLLQRARATKKDTLIDAARELGMGSDANPNAKANVHNIENGNVFLPWKRVVAFAKYTQRNPGAILIALAAARALKEIQDSEEREKLHARLKKLLKIDNLGALVAMADESSIEGYSNVVPLPPMFSFWQHFRAQFPSNAALHPKLAPTRGSYREESFLEIFGSARFARFIIQSGRADGFELALLRFLETSHEVLLPIYLDASSIKGETLEDYVDRYFFKKIHGLKHLSLQSTEIQPAAFFIFYNLPTDKKQLNYLRGLIAEYLHRNHDSPFVIICDQLAASSSLEEILSFDLDVRSFVTTPVPEGDALVAFRDHLRQIGLTHLNDQLPDWIYPVLRSPLWSGIISLLCRELRRIPTQWEAVRATGSVMIQGPSPSMNLREGLYSDLVAKSGSAKTDPALLRQLASSAADALEVSTHPRSLQFRIADALLDRESICGPLLERQLDGEQSFTSTWINCYFAALHYLRKLSQARHAEKPVQAVLKSLNDLYEKGDLQKVLSTNVALSLLEEAKLHEPEIAEELKQAFERADTDQPSGLRIARRVMSIRGGESLTQQEGRKLSTKRWVVTDADQKDKSMYLRVMIEDQAPGWALRSMANTDTLRVASPGKDDAMIVRPVLAAYEIVREAIAKAIRYSSGEAVEHPNVDIIICPHYSLAWELAESGSLITLSTAQISSLTRLGFLANHYCKFQDQWIGVPFQYPTKYLCYRNDLKEITQPPSSFDELVELVEQLKGNSKVRAGIGLQGRPHHPSLYYEWLAIVVALGGGDVLWDSTLRDGEVILDSVATVNATLKFLNLFSKAHPQSPLWDWDAIIHAMADDEIAMCLPFSDTVPELSRLREHKKRRERKQGDPSSKSDISYAPFRLTEEKSPSYIGHKLYGYPGVPLHVFTGHVMVALNNDEDMIRRETRFMQWFLDEQTQREFSARIFQSPYMDGDMAEAAEQVSARYSAAVAQEYAYLPMQSHFAKTEGEEQLPVYQDSVLTLISGLLQAREYRPSIVRKQLEEKAEALRAEFKTKRRQS